ncbi:TPA: N-6 DNA methylase [Pseudomonas aeruginosa]
MNRYKKLKEAILNISDSKRQSISKAERESYSVFIEMSLACAVMSILQKYKSKGYSDKELQNILVLGKPLITENYNFRLNAERLEFIDEAFRIYAEIVKESEPFTDVLSMLHEEILLTGGRGEGLGQFFTPPDLARSVAQLIFNETTEYSSGIISIGEPCCGSGALALSPLNQMYKTAPERLRDVHLVLNDIDSLAVKSAILQVLMTCIYHDIELCRLDVYNANLITEYLKGDTFFMAFETPKEKPEAFKAFEEIMRLVLEVEEELKPEYA